MAITLDKIKFKDNDIWTNLVDLVYPVGSYYMSSISTSPSILFGGTWVSVENRMLIGASSTYTVGATGGATSVTLVNDNLPSHTHTVGAHAHGLNSHTHSVGAHAHGLNSHTHGAGSYSAASNGAHTHKIKGRYGTGGDQTYAPASWGSTSSISWTKADLMESTGAHTHTVSGTSGAASGNTANSTAFNSGAASGNTANSTAFNSGATGSGTAFSTISPYYAAYIWRRTA